VNAAGRNAVVTSLMVCCGFVACFTMNVLYTVVNYVRHTIERSSPFYHFTVVMVLMSSCINPFIYAAKYREFQTGVKRLLRKQVHPAQSGDAAGS